MSDISPQSPQEIYLEIQKFKSRARELRIILREQYEGVPEFLELSDKKKELLDRMKQIKEQVNESNAKEADELSYIAIDLRNLNQMLADVLLAKVTNNEQVEITTLGGQLLLPIFSVKLKKD